MRFARPLTIAIAALVVSLGTSSARLQAAALVSDQRLNSCARPFGCGLRRRQSFKQGSRRSRRSFVDISRWQPRNRMCSTRRRCARDYDAHRNMPLTVGASFFRAGLSEARAGGETACDCDIIDLASPPNSTLSRR